MKRFKRILCALLCAALLVPLTAGPASAESRTDDNSFLLSYEGGDSVGLEKSYSDGILKTPSWVGSLIIAEVRPDKASVGGTLPECYDLVDFYASLGVNGIWLAPLYDRGAYGNGYSNFGPHSLDRAFTGTDDYEEGWKTVRDFVGYAHSKGIYVFLDVITWGVAFNAPLITEHPDWFDGIAWGNPAFNWKNPELRKWFTDTLVNNILVSDADGYRCDCEPNYTGYDIYRDVKNTLSQKGKYIAVISEDGSTRGGVYDFEQDGVLDYGLLDRGELYKNPLNFFGDGYLNIVDSVKKGYGLGCREWQNRPSKRGSCRYYTNCITNHDYQKRDVCGSRINIGYSAVFAPFIPVWYMGDEFNASTPDGVQYDFTVDFADAEKEENAAFLNDLRRMIFIRRSYPEVFEYWPTDHRNSNICKVKSENLGSLQAYARFAGNRAVLIAANNTDETLTGTLTVPFSKCNLSHYGYYRVTDLMTGEIIADGSRNAVKKLEITAEPGCVPVLLVEGFGVTSGLLLTLGTFFRSIPERLNVLKIEFLELFEKK